MLHGTFTTNTMSSDCQLQFNRFEDPYNVRVCNFPKLFRSKFRKQNNTGIPDMLYILQNHETRRVCIVQNYENQKQLKKCMCNFRVSSTYLPPELNKNR